METTIEETVGTRLLKMMLTELRLLSPRYNNLDDEKQNDVIERLRLQLTDEVQQLVRNIASRGYKTVSGKIISITVRDEAKAKVELMKSSTSMANILEAVGGNCLLTLVDAEEFTGGMEQVKPPAAQKDWTQPED